MNLAVRAARPAISRAVRGSPNPGWGSPPLRRISDRIRRSGQQSRQTGGAIPPGRGENLRVRGTASFVPAGQAGTIPGSIDPWNRSSSPSTWPACHRPGWCSRTLSPITPSTWSPGRSATSCASSAAAGSATGCARASPPSLFSPSRAASRVSISTRRG